MSAGHRLYSRNTSDPGADSNESKKSLMLIKSIILKEYKDKLNTLENKYVKENLQNQIDSSSTTDNLIKLGH